MTLLGFKARNHRQQPRNPKVDDRATTQEDFERLSERFGPFDLDVAASAHNAKCSNYFTMEDDGLSREWYGNVWCNPPYSNIPAWVEKAHEQRVNCDSITMLLPANRTEQAWWQDLIEPERIDGDGGLEVRFLRGRMRFIAHDDDQIRPNSRPPFGCCVVLFS